MSVFSNDIEMELGVVKCAVLTMEKGMTSSSEGIALPNKTTLKGMKEGDSCKYLGVIQADATKHHEMKENFKLSIRRVRKILEAKLKGANK